MPLFPGNERRTESMRLSEPEQGSAGAARGQRAYTLAEVLVAVLLLVAVTVALFAAFSTGAMMVQLAREDLRATQILTQKMELVRLFTWEELTDPNQAAPVFSEWYAPGNSEPGVLYSGTVSVSAPGPEVPVDYRNNLRLVTVRVCWTNYVHGSGAPLPRSRQMQTCVARYGMQSYLSQ